VPASLILWCCPSWTLEDDATDLRAYLGDAVGHRAPGSDRSSTLSGQHGKCASCAGACTRDTDLVQRELASGQLKKRGDNQAQASLILEDDSHYEQTGQLQFAEVAVDSGTGSVTLRSVFPNPRHILLPGMFVHEQLEEGINEQGLLVPQRAVTHNQRGEATTIVVLPDNKISTRVIRTEREIDDQWLVSEGVTAGDRVIVAGLQRLGTGVNKVKPAEVLPDPLNGGRAAATNPTGVKGPANFRSSLQQ
jgi:membrane fusion protein, multidrug efflux system